MTTYEHEKVVALARAVELFLKFQDSDIVSLDTERQLLGNLKAALADVDALVYAA